MKRLVTVFVVMFIVAIPPAAADDIFFAYDLIFRDVEIRQGVTADINVLVLKNTDPKSHFGKAIVALHGLANTASTWKPLAEELFVDNPIGRKVRYILAINLAGRGYSSLPKGEGDMLFGELSLEDQVQAVIGTLERIRLAGFYPRTIMAHSQGGLIVQMVQQALIDGGTSLRAKFGIRKAFLLASIGPKEVPWAFADSGYGEAAVGSFIVPFDPDLGTHLSIPVLNWLGLFFAVNPGADPQDIRLAADTPIGEVTTENYNSPEPMLASTQLVGSVTHHIDRPSVERGIFDKTGTRLAMVAMSLDGFQTVSEHKALYAYLTNDTHLKNFAIVASDDAVHSMYISNPRDLLESLASFDITLP